MISEFRESLHDPVFIAFIASVMVFLLTLSIVAVLAIRVVSRYYNIRHIGKDGVDLERRKDVVSFVMDHQSQKYTDRVEYTVRRFRYHEFMTVLQIWKDEYLHRFSIPGDPALEMLIRDSIRIYVSEHQRSVQQLFEGISDDAVAEIPLSSAFDAVKWAGKTQERIRDRLHSDLPDQWADLFYRWLIPGHSVAIMMAETLFNDRDDLVSQASKLSLYLHNRKWLIVNDLIRIERQPRILNGEAHGIVYKNLTVKGIKHE